MTLWAVIAEPIRVQPPRWVGDIIEAGTADEALRVFEREADYPAEKVFEIVPEKVLVRKWVEEEV